MTTARARLINVEVTRWYHCISRCVRRAFLLAEDGGNESPFDRKAWIDARLKELDAIFAISVGGFSVLDNHFHLLLRVDTLIAKGWSAEEVACRWFRLCPPRGKDRLPLPVEKREALLAERTMDATWIETIRDRLTSISWFMKYLKEPLSRIINRIEKCSGTFFEGRFKSIAILDTESLLAMAAYIDLNPVAAGIALTPEESPHTSVMTRVEHVKSLDRIEDLAKSQQVGVQAIKASRMLEEDLWLIPIEDRRGMDSVREGMIQGCTLGNYLALVEYTGRLIRHGKATISSDLEDIFVRLGSSAQAWQKRMVRMSGSKLIGRFIASTREALRTAAKLCGVRHLANLSSA